MTLIIYLKSGNILSSNDHLKYSPKNSATLFTVKIMEQIDPQIFIDEHVNINNDVTSSSPDADDLIEITS